MLGIRPVTDENIEAAGKAMYEGGLVVYPTETCYGLGTNALDETSVKAIYRAKNRPREKKLTMIVANMAMAEQYAELSYTEKVLAEQFMPGPLTLIAEKKSNVPDVTNDKFVFRIPGSDSARALSREAGVPLIATSANITGQGPHYRVKDIEDELLDHIDLALDGGTLDERPPSTIIEVKANELVIHRQGPVRREQLEAVLNEC